MESQENTIFKSLVSSRALKKKEITLYIYVLKNWIIEIVIAYKLKKRKDMDMDNPSQQRNICAKTESQARPYTPNKIQAFRMTMPKRPQLINGRVKEDIALRETTLK